MKTLLQQFKDGEIAIKTDGMGDELEKVLLEAGIKLYSEDSKLWAIVCKDANGKYMGFADKRDTPTVSTQEFISSLGIKSEGYEYRGWKLGQKVMCAGTEHTIVAFDEKNSTDPRFIGIGMSINKGESTWLATSKLKKCGTICWTSESLLAIVNKSLLEVEFTQIENIVCAKVTHMDESLRGNLSLGNKEGYELKSNSNPCADYKVLFVRGKAREADSTVVAYTFSSIEKANEWLVNIKELIVEANSGGEEIVEEYLCTSKNFLWLANGVSVMRGEIHSFTKSEYESHKANFVDVKNAPRDTPIWVRITNDGEWEKAWMCDYIGGYFAVYNYDCGLCKRKDSDNIIYYPQAKFRKV